jgi:hypothetical protein
MRDRSDMYAWQEPSGTWFGPYVSREQAHQARADGRVPSWGPLRLVGCRCTNTDRGIEFSPLEKPRTRRRSPTSRGEG